MRDGELSDGLGGPRNPDHRRGAEHARSVALALAILFAVAATGLSVRVGGAMGDESGSFELPVPTAAQTKELLESGTAREVTATLLTDAEAARSMPHRDLDRTEALELAEAVFEPELTGTTGIVDELEPEKFLSENAALVKASALPEGLGQTDEGLAAEHPNLSVLVESTSPLRAENPAGENEAINLDLESIGGELAPQNPLAQVEISKQLGDGISLPEAGVEISLAEAPEGRTATNAAGQFAFFPEVANNSDLIVTPILQGVETSIDIRSAEAPMQTTYELALQPNSELRPTKEGGAEVFEGDQTTLLIPPPSATDASGNPVQSELSVSGSSITVTTKTNVSTIFPVLVDPTFITEAWHWTINHDSLAAWQPSTTNGNAMEPWGQQRWMYPSWYPGLDLSSVPYGNATSGTHADWSYWVPRYAVDERLFKQPPTSWVASFATEGIAFYEYGNNANYPALVWGLVDPVKGWHYTDVYYGGGGDLNNWSRVYPTVENLDSQHGDKGADMNLVTYENEYPAKLRDTYMPLATIVVVDEDSPVVSHLVEPKQWIKTSSEPISFLAEDHGLGVSSGVATSGATAVGSFALPCNGTTAYPCPRVATSGPEKEDEGHAALSINSASLPTGLDPITVTVYDPVGHSGSSVLQLPVDHTAPEVSLSGTLTEQGSLGTRRPTYSLRVNAKDGVAGAPQSGVKKVEVKLDGVPVPMAEPGEWEPKCQTENCSVSDEWTLNSSAYAAGAHEVQVIATDAVENKTTKTIQIELSHPAPTLALSGALTEQAALGSELPSYKLQVTASALSESPPAAGLPTYSSSFGTSGTGGGQFAHPGDVAIGNEGNLFVVDTNNNRIEKFTAAGTFVSQFGAKGSGNGLLNRPTAIAVAANGNLWVTDSLNRRVEEFTPAGAYVAAFGAQGTGAGQFAGSGPEGIAIDYHGNIWVSDTYGGRLEKFTEAGNFIRAVGTKGTAYEQLGQPTAIDIAPGGQIYVTDWEDDKVAEYGEGGAFIRQFGSQGNEPGQLQQPTGIAIDSRGDVWVGDQNNQRIEEFNLAGEYLRRFGAEGTGVGQFKLQYPIGITTDAVGDVWVTDPLNNRVEKWASSGYVAATGPTFLRAIGSAGTGKGQFNWPTGVAVDAKNNIWITDLINNRLQKFNEKAEWQAEFGAGGTTNGLFNHPLAVAIDPKGHLWVTDTENNRVQEFSEAGAWMRTIGTTTKGTGAGQFNWPAGIAVDSKNHVWVADTANNRLQEFSETGAWMRTIGGPGAGSGAGQMAEPYGVAVSPEGNVWVADTGNRRLDEFSETGSFIRSVGGPGSGVGQFNTATDIDIDSAGNLWVLDQNNARVQKLTSKGEFLSQFGEPGTGPGGLGRPLSLAVDSSGHILVADYERNLVDEWTRRAASSQISTEITVDGKRVDAGEAGCSAETCPLSRTWTLEASKFTTGSHVVVVRATDGLGNTTSKTLNVKVGDTTKPALEVGGELISAPEGWVQQEEGSYSLTAAATDKGFGVTKLAFTIDGKSMASKEQSCAAGKCSASISTSVNVAALAPGAHQAEVVATDGAGNSTPKKWTINVDPDGHISIAEAEATLEAVEGTTAENLMGEATESSSGIPGMEAGLAIEEAAEGELRSQGSKVPIAIGSNVAEGIELTVASEAALAEPCPEEQAEQPVEESEAPQEPEEEVEAPGESGLESTPCVPMATLKELAAREEEEVGQGLKVPGSVPITFVPSGSAPVSEVEGNAAVAPNVQPEVDTIIRPIVDGGFTWEQIRGPAAPEHYAFETELGPRQELRLIGPQEAAAFYRESGIRAFTVLATPAHDVDGSTVPTHLSVNGEVLTLTIEYKGLSSATGEPFVYPIVSGTGWEGGWHGGSELIAGEPTEPPPGTVEEVEEEPVMYQVTGGWTGMSNGPLSVSAPQYVSRRILQGGVWVPSLTAYRGFQEPFCEHFGEQWGEVHKELLWHGCYKSPRMVARGFIRGGFRYELEPHRRVWWEGSRYDALECKADYTQPSWNLFSKACYYSGQNEQTGAGAHLVARNYWRVEGFPLVFVPLGGYLACHPKYVDAYWNGNVSEDKTFSFGVRLGYANEPCVWPQE